MPREKDRKSERAWVRGLVSSIQKELNTLKKPGITIIVNAGSKLAYTSEIYEYSEGGLMIQTSARYETDLLVMDRTVNGSWTPRVVIECKLGGITTHDALTYSTKASTHKHVHPYLRYGFLARLRSHYALPGRLIRHGAYFDFMVSWVGMKPSKKEWRSFIHLLKDEIKASRVVQEILTTSRSVSRTKYNVLHRPLRLSRTE